MKKIIASAIALFFSTQTIAGVDESFEKRMLKEYTGQAKIKQKNDNINEKYNYDGEFLLSSYKQNYILPFSYISGQSEEFWTEDSNMKDIEATFQVSMKYPLALDVTPIGGDVYVTYTNRSHWQLYTSDQAFREIAHEPEVLIDFGQNWEFGGVKNTNILFGYNHQTNGQSGIEKRSWNRLFTDFVFAHKDFSLSARAWLPFSEETDSNKDISDYIGYHELNGRYYWQDQTFSAKTTWAFHEGHGSLTFGWEKPLSKAVSVYVEGFYGYGDTMIDFDEKTERISVGFILTNDLF